MCQRGQGIAVQPLPKPWDWCITMYYSWAYVPSEAALNTPVEKLRTLICVTLLEEILLLNIAPCGNGFLFRRARHYGCTSTVKFDAPDA